MGFENFASENPPFIEIFSDLDPGIFTSGDTNKVYEVYAGGEHRLTINRKPRLKDPRLKEIYGSNEGVILYRGSFGENREFIPQGKVPYEE